MLLFIINRHKIAIFGEVFFIISLLHYLSVFIILVLGICLFFIFFSLFFRYRPVCVFGSRKHAAYPDYVQQYASHHPPKGILFDFLEDESTLYCRCCTSRNVVEYTRNTYYISFTERNYLLLLQLSLILYKYYYNIASTRASMEEFVKMKNLNLGHRRDYVFEQLTRTK